MTWLLVVIWYVCYNLKSNKLKQSNKQLTQGSHRIEKYLHLEGLLEKSLKIKSALKTHGKSIKCLEKSLNSTIFCRTQKS